MEICSIHPKDLIIGDPSRGVKIRSTFRENHDYLVFVSQIESKTIEKIESNLNWLIAMQEELNQFERNNIWTLVSRPIDHQIIGTKWIFRNKLD